MPETVIIVGAGPVGLTLAALLGHAGVPTHLYEQHPDPPPRSMAIGITPPSLRILTEIGLRESLLSQGVRVHRARLYEDHHLLGSVSFQHAGGFILSLPQQDTVRLLRHHVRSLPSVTFHSGVHYIPPTSPPPHTWIVGCDGHRSTIRRRAGISHARKRYPCRFIMADFPDLEQLGPDARITFSPRGSVESFPLPQLQRRWIAQILPDTPPETATLLQRVHAATGIDLSQRTHSPPTVFQPQRLLANTFVRPPFLLCGDAAHVMTPIGGQGMNTGLADARMLAPLLTHPHPNALRAYNRHRQQAFRTAARNTALGMWLGTRTGAPASRLRTATLRAVLRRPSAEHLLARIFAMQTLPDPAAS